MTAVMGVWAMRTLVTVWGTPSSRTRKLSALRPGDELVGLVEDDVGVDVDDGDVDTEGVGVAVGVLDLGLSRGGGAGGGGSSASFFFLRMMVPLSVTGPWSSGGGWVVGFCCWGAGGASWVKALRGKMRGLQAAKRSRRASLGEYVVIVYDFTPRVGRV